MSDGQMKVTALGQRSQTRQRPCRCGLLWSLCSSTGASRCYAPARGRCTATGWEQEGRSCGATHDWWCVNRLTSTAFTTGLRLLQCAADASCSSARFYLQPVTDELRLVISEGAARLVSVRRSVYVTKTFSFFSPYQQLINSAQMLLKPAQATLNKNNNNKKNWTYASPGY